jgi:hypothetical protein
VLPSRAVFHLAALHNVFGRQPSQFAADLLDDQPLCTQLLSLQRPSHSRPLFFLSVSLFSCFWTAFSFIAFFLQLLMQVAALTYCGNTK